jgi:murein DD-endopeptidase MepM/ murein hydrolase activator NlpD
MAYCELYVEHIDLLFYKLRYLTYGLLIIAGLLMMSLLLSFISSNSGTRTSNANASATAFSAGIPDTSNVITNAAGAAVAQLQQRINGAGDAISHSSESLASAATHVSTAITHSGKVIVHGLGTGVTFTARSIGSSIAFVGKVVGASVAFVLHLPGDIFGFISHTAAMSVTIRGTDHTPVPIIDNHSAALAETHAALVTSKPASQPAPQAASPAPAQPNSAATWPIHGAITTGFGVPHWPYQPTHTGLDISDGHPAGVTPIHAFKPGRVIQTVRSYSGYGNHVIIDHGAGITSLYGHLASIAVQPGQMVDSSATLGFEGSTGASTGTHLHFEIRLNGQPVNPLQYVSGRP